MGVDRKSSAHSQNDAIDPNRKSVPQRFEAILALLPYSFEVIRSPGRPDAEVRDFSRVLSLRLRCGEQR